jgi:hypothetical protein
MHCSALLGKCTWKAVLILVIIKDYLKKLNLFLFTFHFAMVKHFLAIRCFVVAGHVSSSICMPIKSYSGFYLHVCLPKVFDHSFGNNSGTS